jgi:hypothetical protein
MKFERTVQSHPASVDVYIRHGWSLVPIPLGSKGPRNLGWNLKNNCIKSQSDLPPDYGIGLAHAYSGTMALDIDNWALASGLLSQHKIDLDALYAAPDAVVIDSGREGRGKLLYQMPFGMALPSKKIISEGQTAYELRCATMSGLTVQDVLPPTIHPDTNQPYRWAGMGHWSRLPALPDNLFNLWSDMLSDDKDRTIRLSDGPSASWDEIRHAMEFITPDCPRDEWVAVGMALHWAGNQTDEIDQAFTLWDDWSLPSHKYPGQPEMLKQWKSFRTGRRGEMTLGSLFHVARRYGWVRPTPDVSELFPSVKFDVLDPLDVLDTGRPQPPEMRFDLWPELLARRAEEVGASVGCDSIIPLFAGLAAVCGVIDARMRLELMPGFKVPPVLWLMTLGDPADKKSPGSRPMLSTLRDLEMEDRPRYQKTLLEWEGKEAAYTSAKKSFLDWSASPEALLGSQAPHVPDPPPQPVPLKFTVSDITSQKLVRDAADRPHGLLCYLDEMNGWINKITDKKSGEDRSAWVVSYESEPYNYDRVGAGSIHCDNLAVSIYGNIQPQVYRANVKNLSSDGLLQRFIPAVIRASRSRVGQPVSDEMTSHGDWQGLLRLVHALPVQTYKLSPEGYQVYRDFQYWYEETKRDERLTDSGPEYMTAFGKLEGLVGRLCLLFHIMEQPFVPSVNADVVKRVVELARGYIIPSLRYTLGSVGNLINNDFEKWLVEHIVQRSTDLQVVTLGDLRRSARRHLENKTDWQKDNMVLDGMALLEQAGWVATVEISLHQRRASWAINPNITTMFQDYRAAVVKAKQRHVDYVYRHAYEKGYERKTVKGYDPELMD